MKPNRYAAVILAAGFSRRMGQFKPLLPLGNTTITGHLISTFLQNSVDVFLVGGYKIDELRAGITAPGVVIVENPRFSQGMFTSVQAGIGAVGNSYRAAFIAPADTPLVSPNTIARLLRAAEVQPGKVCHPTFQNDRGHPPLLPASIFSAITGFQGNGNLKTVLRMYRDLAVNVEVPDPNILFDIDDPADYEELLKRFHTQVL